MNPLSLLTKGRTIRELKERPGAYKLLEKSLLPNFSGTKGVSPINSHTGGSKEELRIKRDEGRENSQPAEPARSEDLSVARRGETVSAAGSGGVSPVARASGEPPAEPAAGTAAPQETPLWGRLAGWARQWWPWRQEQPFQRPAVQTELALDKVKVIRNDLSEDDLEVVTLDKKTGKKTEKPVARAEVEREKVAATPNT